MPEKKPTSRSDYIAFQEKAVDNASRTPPSHEDIAVLAYALWVARGCGDGRAEEDWLEAERELYLLHSKGHAA